MRFLFPICSIEIWTENAKLGDRGLLVPIGNRREIIQGWDALLARIRTEQAGVGAAKAAGTRSRLLREAQGEAKGACVVRRRTCLACRSFHEKGGFA
jgi:hypothetical protein